MSDPRQGTGRGARPFDRNAHLALAAIGRRAEVARRLELGSAEAVLRSVVEAAVALFEAEAASIALYEPARNVLVFRVAAGAQGQGVVGLEIPPDRGLAGYVFSSGQALAIADVLADPRFGRAFAEQTQYVPRSIVAVPLLDERGTLGVLEVLDKRSQATFSLRDIELAGVFARQATVAIRASRVERETATLLRSVIGTLTNGDAPEEGIEALVTAALAEVGDPDDPLWPLVEQIAAIRRTGPEQRELLGAVLDVLVRQAERGRGRRAGRLRARGG